MKANSLQDLTWLKPRDYCVLSVIERLNDKLLLTASEDFPAANPLRPSFGLS